MSHEATEASNGRPESEDEANEPAEVGVSSESALEEDEEPEEARKSPSPPPPDPAPFMARADRPQHATNFESMDTVDILSDIRKECEANQRILSSVDFHSFPDKCDLSGHSTRCQQGLTCVRKRLSTQQAALQDTLAAVLAFNKCLEAKIKEDSLDSWIDKGQIVYSEIPEEIKFQRDQMRLDGARRHQEIAAAMEEFNRFAQSVAEVLEECEEMNEQVLLAKEEVEKGRERYRVAMVAEELRREKEEEERKKAEEKRRKLEAEEAKRRAEEEARRKEEERIRGTPEEQELRRRREEEERQERERRDPRNWPKLAFTDSAGLPVCVVRAIGSEKLDMSDLRVTRVPLNDSIFQLSPNDEIVSEMINIEPAGMETDFRFEEPWTAAVPYTAQRNPAREPVLLGLQEDGSWRRMPSQEVQFEDFPGTKFVETRISSPFCTLIGVLTIKTDRSQVGKKGAKVNSSLDSRISISFPPGAIHVTLNATMQVQPVETGFFIDLKTKHKEVLSHLVTTSHIVNFGIVKKRASKPVTVSIPVPLDPAKKQRPATAVEKGKEGPGPGRPSTAYHRTSDKVEEREELHVIVQKGGVDKWRELKEIEIVTQKNKDVVSFDLHLVEPMRFVAVRTKENTSEESLSKMAQVIDDGLSIRNVAFVLRQKVEDQMDVLIQAVPAHKVDRVLKQLSDEGYDDEGPPPSQEFVVNERQTFDISFRGNVRVEDLPVPLHLMYNSQLKNRIMFTVCEEDKFAQKSIDCYRGFAQIFTIMNTRKLVPRDDSGQRKMVYEEKEERVMLCELLINIPKTVTDTPRPVTRAAFRFKSRDCVDEDYLRQLASYLGHEWKKLAEELGLPCTRVQAIQRNHVQSPQEDMVMDMLLTWVKKMPTSASKTRPLAIALDRCGRMDLAEELREKQRDFDRDRI